MEQLPSKGWNIINLVTALLLMAVFVFAIVSVVGLEPFVPGTLSDIDYTVGEDYTVWEDGSKDTSGIEHVGGLLFTKYVIPFEVLALVLLAALLGSLYMAKKEDE